MSVMTPQDLANAPLIPAHLAGEPGSRPKTDLRKPGRIGAIATLILVGVLGAWAATTVISGAVIANGLAVVHGKPKQVQTLDGGVVAMIAVQDGDLVTEGQVLARLDPTLLTINYEMAQGRLAAALALRARLQAEQMGDEAVHFSYMSLPFMLPDTSQHEERQSEIFVARAAVRAGTQAQLAETLVGFANQNLGVEGQIAAALEQIALLDHDIANLEILAAEGLARQSQMSELQRNRAEIGGQLARLEAERARLTNAANNAQLETLQGERAFLEAVVTELREVTSQTEELILEIATRTAQLERIDIRAPAAGIVHEMQITTIGGVLAPGATVLEIVPVAEGMDFELRLDPRAVDQVYTGQGAQLVIASFDPQSTPKLEATVTTISAGVITDPATGQSYYRVGLSVDPSEIARLDGAQIVPGMPVEAYLETGDRTVLAYLIQPITQQLRRAFRE
ncbi:MAG: HlyD family type I secretion periplasmic adaptor subunit [Rhodobacteraceae bacterium]|nr:HlyD family type I secretion periplasmic adaptor subunit [Paracoccaceae bacterium]